MADPSVIQKLGQHRCPLSPPHGLEDHAEVALGLSLRWLLEPVHQDREAGSSWKGVTATAGIDGVATCDALVRVVDEHQRCLIGP